MATRDNDIAFNLCERLMQYTSTTRTDVYGSGVFNTKEVSIRSKFSRKQLSKFTDVCRIAYACGFRTINFGTDKDHEAFSMSIADYLGASDKKVELLAKREALKKELERVEKEINNER